MCLNYVIYVQGIPTLSLLIFIYAIPLEELLHLATCSDRARATCTCIAVTSNANNCMLKLAGQQRELSC